MGMKQEKKQGKGRRKIEIKKIESKNSRFVTFSKRRVGIFSKASELSILCGAEIAVLIFSPTGKKVFNYGSPSFTSVLDRFLNHQNSAPSPSVAASAGAGAGDVDALQLEYMELLKQLEAEKIRSSELIKKPSEEEEPRWWEAPIHPDMGLVELQRLKKSMVELRDNVAERVSKLMATNPVSSAPSPSLSELELDDSANAAVPVPNPSYDDDDISSIFFPLEYDDFTLGDLLDFSASGGPFLQDWDSN
ncbi:agamous-like MADS-box protein AGL61 [Macadamia integrifolia]|uniref:agamous-like MADS-box protein AGL61 n=1 Tax=Macadamia integrifolia TaxID=60698 RepID=UPI001C4FFC1F|nr:agamous-like MADS-box protein AGL61 [Macadamia integrifolia]